MTWQIKFYSTSPHKYLPKNLNPEYTDGNGDTLDVADLLMGTR